MKFIKVKTRAFLPPKDSVLDELEKRLPKLKEGDVLFIASKILAIEQGRCVKITNQEIHHRHAKKRQLVKQEADFILPGYNIGQSEIILTIKDHTLIPSAGIDESNGDGYFILWPKNTSALCKKICLRLQKKFKLKRLAVVATDSHTTPLRWGTTGTAIGFYGFNPLYDYRGQTDIFGRPIVYTQANIADALSAMAVLLMGEGNEKTPAVILRDAAFIQFTNKNLHKSFVIDPKKDLYAPLLKPFWKRKA